MILWPRSAGLAISTPAHPRLVRDSSVDRRRRHADLPKHSIQSGPGIERRNQLGVDHIADQDGPAVVGGAQPLRRLRTVLFVRQEHVEQDGSYRRP